MSSIVTFYSYKGGVGRSMALANIAYELARKGKKVLMIDWDLEAPGLERYFSNFEINKDAEGLLQLLMALQKGTQPNYREYLWTINAKFEQPIYLLHSGRDKDPAKYSTELEHFDWDLFFKEANGGMSLENLRTQWLADFDLVLIDSRTGLSDASGICTIFLPDIIIPMFTANYQSLFGIRDIMGYIQSARQKLSVDRMAVSILPVPSRFGTKVEFRESQEWLDRIADILKACFSDWLPKWIEPRYVLEQIKVPQVDYFGFGEKLAVFEQGTNDPESMGFIYAKLAGFLASDFTEIETFIGQTYYAEQKANYEAARTKTIPQKPNANSYKHDVFISAPRHLYQWVRELLLPSLTEYLSDELTRAPDVFFDVNEMKAGDAWEQTIKAALERSKMFIFIFSNVDKDVKLASRELIFAETMQARRDVKSIFPVMHGSHDIHFHDLPPVLKDNTWWNFTQYTTEELKSSHKLYAQFGGQIGAICGELARNIRKIEQGDKGRNTEAEAPLAEIESLAAAYENLRSFMPAGNERTRLMQGLVDSMKTKAAATEPVLHELMKSESPGKRLAAIASMHEKPNIEYVDWLAQRVGDNEKPFIGYQAAVGLYIASKALGIDEKPKIFNAVQKAEEYVSSMKRTDFNQVNILQSAKMELNAR